MRKLIFLSLLVAGSAYGQPPKNAVTKCLVSTDFWDPASGGKKTSTVSEEIYYDRFFQILEQKSLSGQVDMFSGLRYYYQDSLCVRKEYLGNSKIGRNEYFFYKNRKLVTYIREENGPFKSISDYQYNNNGVESIVAVRDYKNGVLVSENITEYYYDDKGRSIKMIVQNNDDTSTVHVTYYDSIITNSVAQVVNNATYNLHETFVSFDSVQRIERRLSFHNGEPLLTEEKVFNEKNQLVAIRNLTSSGEVNDQEVFAYDHKGRLTRHEKVDKHNQKIVYTFNTDMPVGVETWLNGKLYSKVNYTYTTLAKKNK